jgi:hypothetical protein
MRSWALIFAVSTDAGAGSHRMDLERVALKTRADHPRDSLHSGTPNAASGQRELTR